MEFKKHDSSVTVKTVGDFGHGDQRNVTLWYSHRDNDVTLLGNLEHGTRIIIDQELVDALQALVKFQEEESNGKKQKAA